MLMVGVPTPPTPTIPTGATLVNGGCGADIYVIAPIADGMLGLAYGLLCDAIYSIYTPSTGPVVL